MNSLTKDVFKIVGVMALSLILFALIFGDKGRNAVWNALEPTFQSSWSDRTYNDGKTLEQKYTQTFNNSVELTN